MWTEYFASGEWHFEWQLRMIPAAQSPDADVGDARILNVCGA